MRSVSALRSLLFMAVVFFLSGCRADLTYRFDVHPASRTVTVSLREKIDQQFYAIATSQGGASALDFDGAKQAGWAVDRSVDDSGDQLIQFSKTMPIDAFSEQGAGSPFPHVAGKNFQFDPRSLQISSGLLTDKASFSTTIPAALPPTDSAANPYASMGAALIPSVMGVHLEIKMPGRVLDTNGERTSDGATRWDINLQRPTEIRYVIEEVDTVHVALLALAIVIAGAALLALRRGSRRRRLSHELPGEPV